MIHTQNDGAEVEVINHENEQEDGEEINNSEDRIVRYRSFRIRSQGEGSQGEDLYDGGEELEYLTDEEINNDVRQEEVEDKNEGQEEVEDKNDVAEVEVINEQEDGEEINNTEDRIVRDHSFRIKSLRIGR